ncbi:hypothetical protein L6164_012289 [Bauhinia variegata]|uniref:Uncharacterized protein n=1 Tax=Bauhinia variegata TaxID=167791 RepID=A0ACB9P9M3_BAUVA|nr:hypothetical protein L6164_012289 [Bauhinia variegata]
MLISRWRIVFPLNSFVIPTATASTHFSAFHSTPCSCQKSSNRSSSARRGQQSSKNHIRFITRQKRADAKKALNDLLYKGGFSTFSFQDKETVGRKCSWNSHEDGHSDSSYDKGQAKSRQRVGKSQKNKKRKSKRRSFSREDSDDDPETMFQARYGKRSYTWSFGGREWTCENSTSGFEWREQSKDRKWENESDIESDDDDSCDVGSCSDRTILGLPPSGPMKMEDVKNAFRLSALKWHPDKHQGSSQAMAEEKFKLCSNAYKSLCSALSTAKA